MIALEKLTSEQTTRFYELYVNYCKQHNQHTSMKDFVIWYEETYSE